jgi:DNA-binding response OmpR family regulator
MLTGVKVLVVEDEYIIAFDIADTLADAGASVIGPVSVVAAALTILDIEQVEAAVLDTNLPDGSILPVLSILVANNASGALYRQGIAR